MKVTCPGSLKVLCLVVFAVWASSTAIAESADPFYKGKTIKVLVSSSPGGGTDTVARLVSRFLPKYLPGNPETYVQNMPAGGGLVANNYFYRVSKPDGLTLFGTSCNCNSLLHSSRELICIRICKPGQLHHIQVSFRDL